MSPPSMSQSQPVGLSAAIRFTVIALRLAPGGSLEVAMAGRTDRTGRPSTSSLPEVKPLLSKGGDLDLWIGQGFFSEFRTGLQLDAWEVRLVELLGAHGNHDPLGWPENMLTLSYLIVLAGASRGQVDLSVAIDDEVRWVPLGSTDQASADWTGVIGEVHKGLIEGLRDRLKSGSYLRQGDAAGLRYLIALLPDEFTLTEAQRAMCALTQVPVDKSNFRKLIKDFVVQTSEKAITPSRPAALFRWQGVSAGKNHGDPASQRGELIELMEVAELHGATHMHQLARKLAASPRWAINLAIKVIRRFSQDGPILVSIDEDGGLVLVRSSSADPRTLLTLSWDNFSQSYRCAADVNADDVAHLRLPGLRPVTEGRGGCMFRLEEGVNSDEPFYMQFRDKIEDLWLKLIVGVVDEASRSPAK